MRGMAGKRKPRRCRICRKRPPWRYKNCPPGICKRCYHKHVWEGRPAARPADRIGKGVVTWLDDVDVLDEGVVPWWDEDVPGDWRDEDVPGEGFPEDGVADYEVVDWPDQGRLE